MATSDWQIVQKILDRTGQQGNGEKAREIARVLSGRIHQRGRAKLTNVCVESKLLSLMRLDRFDLGASIDRVFVHCSKPVFSKFGAPGCSDSLRASPLAYPHQVLFA
jgi:hypothetical protein